MNIEPMDIGGYYFPVNLGQVENLVGKMLTHVEAMNLPEGAEKANKDLVRQSIWSWWANAQENSLTSWKGCIGPIRHIAGRDVPTGVADKDSTYVWYTDIGTVAPTKDSSVSQTDVV